jgi:dihydrofolate synthase/folylpolyglutamate synthase
MDYQQTLDYLYSRLPMFTRIGAVAYKKDLHNTIALCNYLNNPQDKFKSIHIGGTNGKGSTSHMLASILQDAGYKTGLYTSPHLIDFRERIRINGEMIDQHYVVNFTENIRSVIEEISPSFFEVTVGMAFAYFAEQEIDIAIVEVGLGGRLDSTNIITPEISIITNISLDHTNLLGNTVKEIAVEKAGIIKEGVPVIIGEYDSATANVFTDKAEALNSPIRFADQVLKVSTSNVLGDILTASVSDLNSKIYQDLELDLTGSYQLKNVLSVLEAVKLLQDEGYDIPESAIYSGLKNVKVNTGLQGRWQVLGTAPFIVCDTGHNEAGIKEVIKNLNSLHYDQLHIVLGMVKDKDISAVLSQLPKKAMYYFCSPQLERALSPEDIQQQANSYGLLGNAYTSVFNAFEAAKENASKNDVVFIGGSTFVVAEVL